MSLSFRDFQNRERRYELSEERKKALSSLELLLTQATRQQIHQLLGFPERFRSGEVENNVNYLFAIRILLSQRLEANDPADNAERRELIHEIIKGIDEVNRITGEIETLGRRDSSLPDSEPRSDPESDPESERDPEPDRIPSEPATAV